MGSLQSMYVDPNRSDCIVCGSSCFLLSLAGLWRQSCGSSTGHLWQFVGPSSVDPSSKAFGASFGAR